ncbi:MAG TPA: hypothetical protein VGI20_12165 [Rhizomicrobium sp.]
MTALGGTCGSQDELGAEPADLLYRLLAIPRARNVRLDQVMEVRAARSGNTHPKRTESRDIPRRATDLLVLSPQLRDTK